MPVEQHSAHARFVAWLGDPLSAELAGGKAASLSRLAGRRPVPPGFCVTAEAYAAAGAVDQPRDWLRRLVSEHYRRLAEAVGGSEPAVAVRSSAVGEDGTESSFAGQHKSYLNVRGEEAIAASVVRCWHSASSPGALAYRRSRGIDDAPAVAVLVQAMVEADVAAVAFTADPVTGDRETVVVEASWGLGEALVQGLVTPDRYRIAKHEMALLGVELGDKDLMVVPGADGTVEQPVRPDLRLRACLDDQQVLSIARLARDLEDEAGAPVDVECAYAGDRLYLLQCRPITVMAGRPAPVAD